MHKKHRHLFIRGPFVDGFLGKSPAQIMVRGSSISNLFASFSGISAQPYPINKDNRFYLVNPVQIMKGIGVLCPKQSPLEQK